MVRFIAEATDLEGSLISRVTVREMASFFNVQNDAAEFIKETLSTKKHKGRKIRIDEAEQKSRDNNRSNDRGNYQSNRGNRGGAREGGKSYFNDKEKPRFSDRERSSKSFPERKSRKG